MSREKIYQSQHSRDDFVPAAEKVTWPYLRYLCGHVYGAPGAPGSTVREYFGRYVTPDLPVRIENFESSGTIQEETALRDSLLIMVCSRDLDNRKAKLIELYAHDIELGKRDREGGLDFQKWFETAFGPTESTSLTSQPGTSTTGYLPHGITEDVYRTLTSGMICDFLYETTTVKNQDMTKFGTLLKSPIFEWVHRATKCTQNLPTKLRVFLEIFRLKSRSDANHERATQILLKILDNFGEERRRRYLVQIAVGLSTFKTAENAAKDLGEDPAGVPNPLKTRAIIAEIFKNVENWNFALTARLIKCFVGTTGINDNGFMVSALIDLYREVSKMENNENIPDLKLGLAGLLVHSAEVWELANTPVIGDRFPINHANGKTFLDSLKAAVFSDRLDRIERFAALLRPDVTNFSDAVEHFFSIKVFDPDTGRTQEKSEKAGGITVLSIPPILVVGMRDERIDEMFRKMMARIWPESSVETAHLKRAKEIIMDKYYLSPISKLLDTDIDIEKIHNLWAAIFALAGKRCEILKKAQDNGTHLENNPLLKENIRKEFRDHADSVNVIYPVDIPPHHEPPYWMWLELPNLRRDFLDFICDVWHALYRKSHNVPCYRPDGKKVNWDELRPAISEGIMGGSPELKALISSQSVDRLRLKNLVGHFLTILQIVELNNQFNNSKLIRETLPLMARAVSKTGNGTEDTEKLLRSVEELGILANAYEGDKVTRKKAIHDLIASAIYARFNVEHSRGVEDRAEELTKRLLEGQITLVAERMCIEAIWRSTFNMQP